MWLRADQCVESKDEGDAFCGRRGQKDPVKEMLVHVDRIARLGNHDGGTMDDEAVPRTLYARHSSYSCS